MRLRIFVGLGMLVTLVAGMLLSFRVGLRSPRRIATTASIPPHGCEPIQYKQVVFRPGSDPTGVDWDFCPAGENEPSSQSVHVRGLHGNEKNAWTFGPSDYIEQFDVLGLGSDGSQQLLVVEGSSGTGDYIKWCVLGWTGKGLACWPHPDVEAAGNGLLKSDEDFCCKDWTLKFSSGEIVLGRGIYRKGADGNCCPTRGGAFLRLTPKDREFEIRTVWRTDQATYEKWLRSAHVRGPEPVDIYPKPTLKENK